MGRNRSKSTKKAPKKTAQRQAPDKAPDKAPEGTDTLPAQSQSPVDLVEQLVQEFAASVEASTVISIAGDYELADPKQYAIVHEYLAVISAAAQQEQVNDFETSATGTDHAPSSSDLSSNQFHDTKSSLSSSSYCSAPYVMPPGHPSSSGRSNSISGSSSATSDTADLGQALRVDIFDNESLDRKMALLADIFPSLNPQDVARALRNAKENFQDAMDELFTVQYLGPTREQPRGIDAFFKPEDDHGSSKGKAIFFNASPAPNSKEEIDPPKPSITKKHDEAIMFISQRLRVPFDEVSNVYIESGLSKELATLELLGRYLDLDVKATTEEGESRALQLTKAHKFLPPEYAPVIVHLADDLDGAADEIAALLNKHFAKESKRLKINYTRPPIEDDIDDGRPPTTTRPSQTRSPLPTSPQSISQPHPLAIHQQARNHAIHQATQAHRKGKSSPLYRQAATIYAERAQDHARHIAAATSAATAQRIAQTRTTTQIDLHGATVKDGIQIALEEASHWWTSVQNEENPIKRSARRNEGFRIITGGGKHSAGGISMLKKGVGIALLNKGWKVQAETAAFLVIGRR